MASTMENHPFHPAVEGNVHEIEGMGMTTKMLNSKTVSKLLLLQLTSNKPLHLLSDQRLSDTHCLHTCTL